MQFDIGMIVEGKVTGITKFGAFVELEEGTTGMVHISEVASAYVNEISEFLTVGQTVKVKVLKMEDKKISLSIKQAQENKPQNHSAPKQNNYSSNRDARKPSYNNGGGNRSNGGNRNNNGNRWDGKRKSDYGSKKSNEPMGFEDMMAQFKQSSDEKMSDIKKNIDGKRGSYFRRSTTKSK